MTKQYEVCGAATVLGHQPGERFHAGLKPDHEQRMLVGGFLKVVSERTEPPWKEEDGEEATATPKTETSTKKGQKAQKEE